MEEPQKLPRLIREPVCYGCAHHFGDRMCEAFPGGIPDKIMSGEDDHTQPFPGDHGIRYEPAPWLK